jgi:hypothetical protein
MPATYTDVVDAMINADRRGLSPKKVVMTEKTMNTFLVDSNFTEADERRQNETIGSQWEIAIESGDSNYLVTEDGTEISL